MKRPSSDPLLSVSSPGVFAGTPTTNSIHALLPSEWSVKESLILVAPDLPLNIIISSEPVEASLTTSQYALSQGLALSQALASYQEISFRPIRLLSNRECFLRQFLHASPPDPPVMQVQVYHVAASRAYTLTATTPQALFAALSSLIFSVLAHVTIDA